MAAPNIAPLVSAIRSVMPVVPKRAKVRLRTQEWPYPPLLAVDTKVGGLSLAPYFDVCPVTVDTVRAAWEEYIHFYVAEVDTPTTKPRDFLCEKLELQSRPARWLVPVKSTTQQHLASILAVLSNKVGVSITFSDGGAVLETPQFRVGVEGNGRVISKFHTDLTVEPFDYETAMKQSRVSTNHNDICASLATYYRESGRIENPKDREGTRLALRLLYFTYGYLGRLSSYLFEGVSYRVSRKHMVDRLGSQMFTVANPIPLMWKELVVAGHLTESQFNRYFKHTPEMRHEDCQDFIPSDLVTDWYKTITTMETAYD